MTQSLRPNSTHDRRNTIESTRNSSLSITGRPNGGKIIQDLERDKRELQELVQSLEDKIAQMEQKQRVLEKTVEKLSTQQETMIAQQEKQFNMLITTLSQKMIKDSERSLAQSQMMGASMMGSQQFGVQQQQQQQQFSPPPQQQQLMRQSMNQYGAGRFHDASGNMNAPMQQQYHQQSQQRMGGLSAPAQQHQQQYSPPQQQSSIQQSAYVQQPYTQQHQYNPQQDNFNAAQDMQGSMMHGEAQYYTQQQPQSIQQSQLSPPYQQLQQPNFSNPQSPRRNSFQGNGASEQVPPQQM